MGTGALYVVSTPIGNLEDITLRALRILKSVALIAAEDTRRTRKLLTHFGIKARLTSYFEHNERLKAGEIIEVLKGGLDVALVSDAGTPGISDPGYRLIELALADEKAIQVVPVPGASALLSVLSVSGMPIDAFTFLGFVPSGDAAKNSFFLETLAFHDHTFVVYESARRLKDTLISMRALLGDVHVCMGREMTKAHEEALRGALSVVIGALNGRELKGEVTLVFRTLKKDKAAPDVPARILRLLDAGMSVKDAVKAVSTEFDLPRGEVYREALKVKGSLKSDEPETI
ncbi:MAG: 16S rRNA (cytidine(1402)-2'-O)-methyltransferase [Deltaproteobacteria bacterium]|nr:16S rRNA (cytidine(1402)-2'-O)-methyltransferase [Deltaproteobacteria bacterium]